MARVGEAEASPVALRAPSEAPASPGFCLDIAHSPLSNGLSNQFVRRGNERTGMGKGFSYAIKCALHEQIHVKQSNYAHAYHMNRLPSSFNDVARYFIQQPETYTPSHRSERLYRAQACEREAFMATNSVKYLAPR